MPMQLGIKADMTREGSLLVLRMQCQSEDDAANLLDRISTEHYITIRVADVLHHESNLPGKMQ